MSWSALFLAHAKPGDIFNAVMCGFLDLLYLDSEHRLRLIEHGAKSAPCSILQADALWPSFFSLFY